TDTYLNTETGWSLSSQHELPTAIYTYADSKRSKMGEFVDVNGDGLLDWVLAYTKKNSAGTAYIFTNITYLSTGSGWTEAPAWAMPNAVYNVESGNKTGEFVDANGDGLRDWILGYASSGGTFTDTYLNAETGWSVSS